jgi:hypothetical protein
MHVWLLEKVYCIESNANPGGFSLLSRFGILVARYIVGLKY